MQVLRAQAKWADLLPRLIPTSSGVELLQSEFESSNLADDNRWRRLLDGVEAAGTLVPRGDLWGEVVSKWF
jgi:hypothetical protein